MSRAQRLVQYLRDLQVVRFSLDGANISDSESLRGFAAGLTVNAVTGAGAITGLDGEDYVGVDVGATSGAFSGQLRSLSSARGEDVPARVVVGDRELDDPGRITTAGVTAEAIRFFIGEEGMVISPTMSRIDRLTSVAVLRAWEDRVGSRAQGLAGCVSALRRDLDVIEQELASLAADAEASAGTEGEGEVWIGQLAAITSMVAVESSSESMTLQLTHARRVGGDVNWDDVLGDDLEDAIAFGPNGFMSEKYSRSEIGASTYLPVFGCGSLVDVPEIRDVIDRVRERDDTAPVTGDDWARARDIAAGFAHVDSCGHNCAEEGDGVDGIDPYLTVAQAAAAVVEAYVSAGPGAVELFDRIRARAHAHATDLWRGSPVYWSSGGRGVARVDDLRDGDDVVYTGIAREDIPSGIFSESFPDPDTLSTESMRYDAEFTDNERRYLRTRVRLLKTLRTGSLSRPGFTQPQ
jgi:hypothetical protein